MAEESAQQAPSEPSEQSTLRIWPAAIIAAAGILVSTAILQLGSTNDHNVVGMFIAPGVTALLLLLWWVIVSGIPFMQRFAGVLILAALMGIIYYAQPNAQAAPFLLATAIPYLFIGPVIIFFLLQKTSWKAQSTVAILYLLVCTGVYGMSRVDSVGGNLEMVVRWRWDDAGEGGGHTALDARSPGKTAQLPAQVGAEDWPSFRGPHRNSALAGVSINADWSTPPAEVWRHKVGIGWTSFAAVGDYLFTQEQRGESECTICYDATTGEEVWINTVDTFFEDVTGSGPRATPTYLDGKLYVQGATGILQCLNAANGETIWQRNLLEDTETEVPQWGFTSSPLIVGDTLIQFCGGTETTSVIAYAKETGELLWNKGAGKQGYGSGHPAVMDGVEQVLVTSNYGVQSFVPASGELLWEHAWPKEKYPRVVQPVLDGTGGVYIGTAGGQGTRRVDVKFTDNEWRVTEGWTTRKFRPYFNDTVYHDGHIYGFDGDRFMCINLETGERVWTGERCGGQALFIEDMGAILLLTEKGEVVLVKAQPDAYEVLSRFQAIEGKTWNHPVIANGKLYVRNSEEMACFDLGMSS